MTRDELLHMANISAIEFRNKNKWFEFYSLDKLCNEIEKGTSKERLIKMATLEPKDGKPSNYLQLFADTWRDRITNLIN